MLGLEQADEWRAAIERQELADVFHLPEYHAAAEANGDGEALLFHAEDGDAALVHPFLIRPIDEELSDIETVYGYSGPLAASADREFLVRAWDAFDGWCAERRVVAEFVRFNPLSENERTFGDRYETSFARDSVVVDLTPSARERWQAYSSGQRNMVRRAEREGLDVGVVANVDAFAALYRDTMRRVGADRRYFFSDAYFSNLHRGLGERLRLFGVRRGEDLVAAAIFLVHRDRMHYHLAASHPEARRGGASNLLLHAAIDWGAGSGLRILHLGGGLSPDHSDSLFRFKASVSRLTRPVYVGGRVHDAAAYKRLCEAWLRRHGAGARPGFFLLWRADA